MDGRRLAAWMLTGAGAVAAVGCGTTQKTAAPPQLPGLGESRFAKLFAPKPPGPTAGPQPEVVAARKAGSPIKPETDVTFANVQVEAAFLEDRSAGDRDKLLDEARTRYQRVLAKDPANADALRGMARLYTRAGERDRAVASFQQLLQHHPKDHKAAHELALTCGRFDDWAGAVSACEYALAVDPENRRYHRTFGVCLGRSGQHDKAFDALMKVMTEAEARYAMAKMLLDADQPDLGKQQLQLAAQADPAFTPAKDLLGQMNGGGAVRTVGHEETK